MLNRFLLSFMGMVLVVGIASAADKTSAEEKAATTDKGRYFAIIGGEVVPVSEYLIQLRVNARKRFFHGKAPDEEVAKFKREIADKLIDKTLLLQEARRRDIKPVGKDVQARLDKIKKARQGDPEWEKRKDDLLPGIAEELNNESMVAVLEKKIRDIPDPAEKQIRAYYDKHPDVFTAPEQIKVSLIMLKVDPSSSSDVWEAAREEAAGIVSKLRAGADFAEMARIHSGDESAARGGSMGYVHKGMLALPAQQVLDMMDPVEISEPVMLLQGVAIFRLDDRTKPKLNAYAKVKDRATALARRELSEKTWQDFVAGLRKKTSIKLNEELLKVASEDKQGK